MANKSKTPEILEYIQSHPHSDCRTIGKHFGIRTDSVRDKHIKKLRQEGKVYISSYSVEPGHHVACFSAGSHEDVSKEGLGRRRGGTRPPARPKEPANKTKIRAIPRPKTDPLTAFALGISYCSA